MLEATKVSRELGINGQGPGEPAKVLLVDDHPMIREGMKRLLEEGGEFVVVGEVDSVEEALNEVKRTRTEIVVMDIQLPGLDGVEGTRLLKANHPEVKVVIVSAYGENYLVPCINAGADGYLLKTLPPGELAKNLKLAALGYAPIDPTLNRLLMDRLKVNGLDGTGSLTERQQNILRLVSNGLASKEIAFNLAISLTTLKREFRNTFNLLGVNDRAHAVAEAIRQNMI